MQLISAVPMIARCVTLTILLAVFFSTGLSQAVQKQEKVPDRVAYAHMFNMVLAYDTFGESGKNELRLRAGLTGGQYQILRDVSYQFDAEFRSASGQKQMALPVEYQARLKKQLSQTAFNKLDRFVREKIAPDIQVVRSESASPEEFSYSSSITASESNHELKGVSITVTFSRGPGTPEDTCSVSGTMSGPGISVSGSDSGQCGNYNPRVTLIANNYQVNSQYCMAGSHSGSNGQSGSSSQCVTTANPGHISKVEYEQIATDDAAIDANPNAGSGRRIYPDKKIPADTVDRRKIRVKATYTAATAGISIYFRNFDMDDPSASAAPLDTNDSGGVNGGDDNYGNVDGTSATKAGVLVVPAGADPNPYNCQAFTNGTVSGVVCETDATGVAKVDFIVTRQPGDNFSVTASQDQSHSEGLVLTADGANVKDVNNVQMPVTTVAANGCENYSFKTCRVEMITVWRRLHIETDSMGNVGTTNKITGTINGSVTIGKKGGLVPTFAAVAVTVSPALELSRFDNGRLVVGSNSLFVSTNNANTVVAGNATSKAITLNNGDSFTLYDDDDYNANDSLITSGAVDYFTYAVDGDNSEALTEFTNSRKYLSAADGNYSDGKPKNVYASAYVMPEYNWAASVANFNQSNITFDLNVVSENTETDELFNALNANRGSSGSEADDFWVAYFLVGYQGNLEVDADGCRLNTQTGQCLLDPSGQYPLPEGANSGISRRLIISVAECDCYQSTACPGAVSPNPAPTSCTTFPTGAFGSLLFHEVQRDTERSWLLAGYTLDEIPTTAPHELGHQFGLKGDQPQSTFKLMDYSILPGTINDIALHAEHINLIRRRVKSPGK